MYMEVTDLINLIVNNGFAIAVAAYLLIRLEKQIANLSSSINKLNTIISAKLGVAIDTDSSNDDSHKVAWEKWVRILRTHFTLIYNFRHIFLIVPY